jgi:hypothetical protein
MNSPPLQQNTGSTRTTCRVSPISVVPQKEWRPRTIIDYSYYSLNAETLPLTPMEAMQFGRALERYIRKIVHADPRFGPVKMIKVDLADGFYRVWVNAPDVIKLGVAFPNLAGKEPLIAFPIALPMAGQIRRPISAPPRRQSLASAMSVFSSGATPNPIASRPWRQPNRLLPWRSFNRHQLP